jgi:predicted RNase H-like nuclease (RuvC/YqgF family)
MALGDKVDELQRSVATLAERLDNARTWLNALDDEHKETARQLADLKREHERKIALLEREVEELRKWKDDKKKQDDEWARRLWAFGPNLLAAVIGGLIAAAIAYFIKRP